MTTTSPAEKSDGERRRTGRTTDAPSVCVFTSAHDATDSRVVHREAASLARAGYDVTYYTPFGDADVEGIDVVTYATTDGDVSVPGVRNRLRWAVDVAALLSGTDFDVYHFHDVELLPVGVALATLTDGAVVYDVHENVADVLGHKDIFPQPIRPILAAIASSVELVLSTFVDAIVVASPDIAERFDGYDDVTVVTNYPWRRWAEETDVRARSARAEAGEAQFVYCGLLSEDRGILTMMEAIDRVPDEYDASLVLGGKYASDAIEARIERRAAASDRVELVGWLPSLAAVVDLFRRSDVGMLCFHPDPNKTNAMHRSNKLFQYMAAGLPIVVSDVGEWPRLVTDVGCGVPVDPEDPDAMAGVMVELIEDADRRVALGRNGHRAALERFNWETQREKLLALYERLAG